MKNNYFPYFNKLASGKLYTYISLNFLVGLLDGIGLTLFIPLIYISTNNNKQNASSNIQYITQFFDTLNIPLNIYSILGFMIFVFFAKAALSYYRSIFFTQILQKSARKIRLSLTEGLSTISYEGYTKLDSGEVHNNMTTEANRLTVAVSLYMSAIQNIAMLAIYITLAICANWQFAILVTVGGLLTNFIYKFLNKITVDNARKVSSIGMNFQALLIQSLHNFKYLKATNYYSIYNKKLTKEIIDSEDTQFKIGKIAAISDSSREPIVISIISLVLIFQLKVMHGEMESMMAALLLFYRSLTHLATVQSFWNKFLANAPAKESIEKMLTSFKKYEEKNHTQSLSQFGDINVNNLNFNYGNRRVLDQVSLNIQNKKSIALVGESGAGKTTLANILCGLILPQDDSVKINNQNINSFNINTLRDRVGYVTQEPVIFDDSLFNNITFWGIKNENNLKKFWNAIDMASLNSFVNTYPEKENIQLGNNGILISGGQKQRISIARELYKSIDLMIMDEATSALDSETEKFIKDQIDMLHGKFTLIVIAHRLSTIKNVDVIYLMQDGKILDSGSYNQLYSSSEKFRKMVDLQSI